MLFKILALERTWEVYPTLTVKPRQLFVTQSRMLASLFMFSFLDLSAKNTKNFDRPHGGLLCKACLII